MNKFIVMLGFCGFVIQVWAAEVQLENIRMETDVPAMERGAEIVINACQGCHSLKYIKYRDLITLGMDKKMIDAWRGDKPLDTSLTSLMPEEAAKLAFGLIPPDLSLITKAREGGSSYVYSYLIGYYLTPEGMPSNHIFPETKMPDALGIGGTTDPAQRVEIQGKARDVVSFLAWASDPHERERYQLGYYVIGYLVVLTLLLYFVKNKIWARLK